MSPGDAPMPIAGAPLAPAAADDPAAFLMQAIGLTQAGQFGVAAQCFGQAATGFEAYAEANGGDPTAHCVGEYCRAMAEGVQGFDLARQGNRAKALECQTNAINRIARRVLPLADRVDDSLRSAILLDFNYLKAGKYAMEMMQDIFNEDFDSARRTAARIFADLDQTRGEIAGMGVGSEIGPLRATVEAVVLAVRGLDRYAAAEDSSAEREWEAALDAFADAKQCLRDARDAYAAAPNLQSQAQVWDLLVDTLVEPARRRCRRMQRMWEDLERFKDGMATLARAVGAPEVTTTTVVNNTARATADLKSRIDVQMTLINNFENRARSALQELRAAIEAAPADSETRIAALDAIGKVIAPPAHDGGFFDRFKRFCSDSAEVVEDVAKVAGPVAIAWNVLAPFFGLPVLPVPAR